MITLYVNTVTDKWYDADGNLFRSNTPSLSVKSREEITIITCTETDAATPAEWKRDTSFAQFNGISAVVTCDSDYIQKIKGSLVGDITPGERDIIEFKPAGDVTLGLIPMSGTVRIYAADGTYEALEYSSREKTESGTIELYVGGASLSGDYAAGSVIDTDQAPYCEAFLDLAKSDISSGKWVFDLVADSYRIRETVEYSNVQRLNIAGLEFLPFYIGDSGDTIRLKKYLLSTFAIVGVQGNPDGEGQIPDAKQNQIAAVVGAKIAEGISVETRTTDTGTQMRLWLNAGGETNKSDWVDMPAGAVVTGAGEIKFTVASGTVTYADGSAYEIEANEIPFSGGVDGILGTVGECEYDVCDSDGLNITTDPALRRQWIDGNYCVTMLTGWADGTYYLKPNGIKGDKGDPGSGGVEYTAGDGVKISENNEISADIDFFMMFVADETDRKLSETVYDNLIPYGGYDFSGTLNPRDYVVCDFPLNSISFDVGDSGNFGEAVIRFTMERTSTAEPFAVLPAIQWVGGTPEIELGKSYIISIKDGLGVCCEVSE